MSVQEFVNDTALSADEQGRLRTALAREVRRSSALLKSGRQPCYICGEHRQITQMHHVISVASLVDYLMKTGARQYQQLNVWLCPNHHAYWHRLESTKKRDRIAVMKVLGDDAAKFFELMERRNEIMAQMYGVEIPDVD